MSDTTKPEQRGLPRREFVRSATLAAAGVTIVPRHVLGGSGFTAPSDMLNIAGVGVGGMGRSNMTELATQNIVALCDVIGATPTRASTASRQQVARSPQKRLPGPAARAGQRSARSDQIDNEAARREASARRSDTATTARCWRSRRTSTAVVDRHAGSHARGDRAGRDGSRQARLRAEAARAGRSTRRARWRRRRPTTRRSPRRWATRGTRSTMPGMMNEYIQAGAIGDVKRSARLDQPAARLLAAGHSAPRAAASRRRPDSAQRGTCAT